MEHTDTISTTENTLSRAKNTTFTTSDAAMMTLKLTVDGRY